MSRFNAERLNAFIALKVLFLLNTSSQKVSNRCWRKLSRHELWGCCHDEMHFMGVYYRELDALDATSGWKLTRRKQSTTDASTCYELRFVRRNFAGIKTKPSLCLQRKTTASITGVLTFCLPKIAAVYRLQSVFFARWVS